MNANAQPVVAYYGLNFGNSNQYSGDIARGVSASYQRVDSPSQYWEKIPGHKKNWKGWDLWEIKYDMISCHIYYAKNLTTNQSFFTKSNIPQGMLDLISFDCRSHR